ncbi:Lrp/AsnC family transcriptional regulator [Candidatus Pacearchaeota archaeon]|nr:Lrp/AsnC family transcriptional regulator [Candidatus Pacearchaeota archaeon]
MKIKLDKVDKKLISYLYHHYREPLTKIAKACKISRDQVEYRLKKYEQQGLIRKYLTIFNYDLLGYREFTVVWLKLKASNERKIIIKKQLENMKNVVSVGDALANYDLFMNFVFKDKREFESEFNSFLEKNKQFISDYSVFITTSIELFPLKELGISKEEETYQITNPSKPINLDKKDLSILKALEKNGRARIIDIARETGLSSELIIYKLKQFYKNKIILGTRILFDMEKLGFYFGLLRIKLRNSNEPLRKKIREFCRNHKHVNALAFGIADYSCGIQIFYKKESEFREAIRDITNNFENEIEDSQIILIENEGRVRTLSF